MKFIFELEVLNEEDESDVFEQLKNWEFIVDLLDELEDILSQRLVIPQDNLILNLRGFGEYWQPQIDEFLQEQEVKNG